MNKSILTLLLSSLTIFVFCQTKNSSSKFNFGFENLKNGSLEGWSNFGNAENYTMALDSLHKKSGKYAASIQFNEGNVDFKAFAFTFPENYSGKKIKLSGYIKTENVSEGYAGLWMRIDPDVAFDNMENRGVKGTTDWQKYEITLVMDPEKTDQIVIGALLAGKGKMWVDDLKVTIDGKDIEDLKPFQRKLFSAEKDKEFDLASKIEITSLSKEQVENIKTLGLLWGFLKYYHPNIAKGNFNWDYELFRVLPKVLNSTNQKNRDDILRLWIESLGEFSQAKEKKMNASDIKFEADLNWINAFNFSKELTDLLQKIKSAEHPKSHYYIDFYRGASNPEFKNEDPHSAMKYPDVGYRILSLFRYWNIIQYYFPYKNLIQEDWKKILEEFIPKLVAAKNESEYTLAMVELIGKVKDTHANIWGRNEALIEYFGANYAVPELTFIENKAVVTGFYDEKLAQETALKVGDIITKINNKTIEEIVSTSLKYYPASNYSTQLRDIALNLLRSNDSIIAIEFLRDGKIEQRKLRTFSTDEINIYAKYQKKDTSFRIINKDIAYLDNGFLQRKEIPNLWKEIRKTKGLIIDIRNYPSDFPLDELSNYLMPKSTPFTKITTTSTQNPGLFTFTKELTVGKKNKNYYKGKVVILINEISQSSSEFHTMGYRVHPNATVIGSTTAGADGNVSMFYLPGGLYTMISGIGIYYPDGKETQGIGIVPDIKVKPSIEGIKNGRDELMEKAIEVINEK